MLVVPYVPGNQCHLIINPVSSCHNSMLGDNSDHVDHSGIFDDKCDQAAHSSMLMTQCLVTIVTWSLT